MVCCVCMLCIVVCIRACYDMRVCTLCMLDMSVCVLYAHIRCVCARVRYVRLYVGYVICVGVFCISVAYVRYGLYVLYVRTRVAHACNVCMHLCMSAGSVSM